MAKLIEHFYDAVEDYGPCPKCEGRTFRVEYTGEVLTSIPEQYPFVLICERCGEHSPAYAHRRRYTNKTLRVTLLHPGSFEDSKEALFKISKMLDRTQAFIARGDGILSTREMKQGQLHLGVITYHVDELSLWCRDVAARYNIGRRGADDPILPVEQPDDPDTE